MSSVGKLPILIPKGIEVKINGNDIAVKGPKGELSWKMPVLVKAEVKDGQIFVRPRSSGKEANMLWGLARAGVANMVKGASEGFVKKLLLEGVGYRTAVEGKKLVLKIGYSHPVEFESPEGVYVSLDKKFIVISGADKQAVGEFAAKIKAIRPVEPYKGKGFTYEGEYVRRKAGKKAAASAGA